DALVSRLMADEVPRLALVVAHAERDRLADAVRADAVVRALRRGGAGLHLRRDASVLLVREADVGPAAAAGEGGQEHGREQESGARHWARGLSLRSRALRIGPTTDRPHDDLGAGEREEQDRRRAG